MRDSYGYRIQRLFAACEILPIMKRCSALLLGLFLCAMPVLALEEIRVGVELQPYAPYSEVVEGEYRVAMPVICWTPSPRSMAIVSSIHRCRCGVCSMIISQAGST